MEEKQGSFMLKNRTKSTLGLWKMGCTMARGDSPLKTTFIKVFSKRERRTAMDKNFTLKLESV